FNTNYDYLVVKFGPDGVQRWAQRFDGPAAGFDQATEVAVDGGGNVYVSGFSYGQSQGQAFDWLTQTYDVAGNKLWERRHSGPGTADDRVADLALTPDGNLVVTGFTKNTGDELTNDIETLVYDPAGTVVWQRRWTDTAASHDTPADLDVDTAGRITITGTTAESASPYAVPSPVTLRYDRSGTLLQTIRGAGGESVDADAAGGFTVAGFFLEPPGVSAVTRYDAGGARLWSIPLTIGSEEVIARLTVRTDSTGAVTLAGTARNVFVHNDDYLTIRYAADGRELWRYRFEGPAGGDDRVAGLAVDGSDIAWVTGTSWNGYLSYQGTADDIVTLRFPAGTAPQLVAPSDLTARGVSPSQIALAWQDNAGTEDGFRIERCPGNGCTTFTEIAVTGHDVTSYTDSGLARNTQYSYRVRAFNTGGPSAYSNVATGKTTRR
ncbi:MAG TPA: fibronectin type III domain-containing protein, partial [Kribbellaceae bacterium]